MLLYFGKLLITTLVCSLTIVLVTGNGSPVLIKTGKKGKDKMILISGGKCGSPTLIKGSKKGGSEMILVGGQQDCDKPKVQIMKQFVPVPYYVPRPIYKYILRHHYVPVRQVVVKPVPVPYPVKSYAGNEHSYNYGGTSPKKGYSQHSGHGQTYNDYSHEYSGYGNEHASDGGYGTYGGYSKATTASDSYDGNNYDYGGHAAGSHISKYSPKLSNSQTDDAYYGGVYGNKDFNGVYKSAYDSPSSDTSMQIESFMKQSQHQAGNYPIKNDDDISNYESYRNFITDDYQTKNVFDNKKSKHSSSPLLSTSFSTSSSLLPSSSSSSSYSSSPTSSSSSSSLLQSSSSSLSASSSSLSPSSSSPTASTSSVHQMKHDQNSNIPKSSPTQVTTYLSGAFGMPQTPLKAKDQKSTSWKRYEKKNI